MIASTAVSSVLNGPQQQAVEHVSGPLLVFAGAGSGKTRVITYRVAHLIAKQRVHPTRILAVTFTNKAAGEMRERLTPLVGAETAEKIWVGTFHAICARLLRKYAEAVGLTSDFVIYDDSDQKAVVNRVLKELEIDEKRFPPRMVLGRISREKNNGFRPADLDTNSYMDEIFVRIYRAYEQRLHDANAVDFDDLLLFVTTLLEDPLSMPGIELRERFDHILVDEFQDVNTVQYRMVKALSERTRNLCVVGDDDQSIYQWRGADVRNIRGFNRDFPDATVIKLEENYRSSSRIVGAALGVIRHSAERVPKELFTNNDPGEPIRVVTCRDERDEANFISTGIKSALENGIRPREIGVFYRIHAMSRVLEEGLRNENIPYRIVGGTRFFDRAEIKDILAYLRVVMNPKSDVDMIRIINVPARGIGATSIDRLMGLATGNRISVFEALEVALTAPEVAVATRKKLKQFHELIKDLKTGSLTWGPSELASKILDVTGYKKMLQQDDSIEAESRLENIEELIGSIQDYESETNQSGGTPSLAGYLERVTLSTTADESGEDDRVLLMTVHSSKGLEFNTVFIAGMEEDLFPYKRQDDDDRTGSRDEEERRLAYVALTRAKHRLFLLHTTTRSIFGTTRYTRPSRYLANLSSGDVQHEVTYQAKYAADSRSAANPSAANTSARTTPWWERNRSQQQQPPISRPSYTAQRTTQFEEKHYEPDDYSDNDDSFGVGSRVEHPRFGVGIVKQLHPGADPAVVAYFESWGEKKILVRFLKRVT